jgi:replicative superfamily II helicase
LSPREGIVAELARNGSHRQEYVLKDVVAKGVAFHHAGLTADERELVERAYWSGTWRGKYDLLWCIRISN